MQLIKILLLLQLIISLNSCGPLAYKKVDSSKISNDPDERVRKNIEEGKSFRLLGETNFGGTTTYEFASSNELWRATLDTIDFMPLTTANYSGGIIVTDWYSDNQNLNENIKITIRFLTNEIRSDALDLKIFYRNCDSSNKCKIIEKEGNLSKELKKEILKKAVIYQQQAKDKKDKKD
ncbi:DUF3576 domain-containing protein [Candidatus Pelagibacter sp.]|nr:DUF3576 domain-containing protein [Candidatus Pelagibacter sp.]